MVLKNIIIDSETGEILSEKDIRSKEEIDKGKIIEKINNRGILAEYISKEVGNYIHLYFKNVDSLTYLTESEKLRLIFFSTFSNYEGYLSIVGKGNRSEYLNKRKLMEISGMKTRTFNSTYKSLIDNELLIEENGKIKVNRIIANKGKVQNKSNEYARVFAKTVQTLFLNCRQDEHKILYYLFKILPFVHLETNIVCENPLECDISLIKSKDMKQICDIIGYQRNNSSRLFNEIKNLEIGNQPAFGMFTTKYGNNKLMVNPRLYYMGSKLEHFEFLDKLFNL